MTTTVNNDDSMTCQVTCWGIAALGAILCFVMLQMLSPVEIIGSLLVSGILFGVVGLLLARLVCTQAPPATEAASAPLTAPSPSVAAPVTSPLPKAPPAPTAAATIGASAPLAGEAELAARKGSWSYDGGAGKGANGAAPAGEDYDGDGTLEGENEGTKPETLSAAREGGPDNLKEIKGVGPKLEKMLNDMGFYHFDQVANWTPDEIAWVNANLEGFKGRVTRDDWVPQARILAAGGDTEFSKRVDKGGVY